MKFLFINPFYPLSEMPSPPLGIGYLCAALADAGIEARVFDMVAMRYSPQKLEAVMRDFQPDVVGATSVTMTFNSAIRAIEDAKRIDPDVVTAMGGAHVSFCAERTLREHPALDIVAQVEGEQMIVEMCHAVLGKRSLASVAGLAYRDRDTIVNNGGREGWIDVNTLPMPARELVPLARYRAMGTPISMTSSRGCPFQCIFCTGRKLVGAKIRWREAPSVVDEMEQIAAMGFARINMADDLFTARKPHAYAVSDEIIRRGLKVGWTSFANVMTVDVPLLKRMREAGCHTVSFGLESGNQEILKTVKKGTKLHRILQAVEACNEAGMQPHGSFIVGLPGETSETLRETLAFAARLRELGCPTGFHQLAPFPGTPLREEAARFKLKILTDDWSQYAANHAITETEGIDTATQDAIAAEIDGATERHFLELAGRIDAGTASAADREAYAEIERQGVYYDLMMKDLLELHGSFLTETSTVSRQDAVAGLTSRVSRELGRAEAEVLRAIEHGLDHRVLRYRSQDGVCSFQFDDPEGSLPVTEIVRRKPAPEPQRMPIPA